MSRPFKSFLILTVLSFSLVQTTGLLTAFAAPVTQFSFASAGDWGMNSNTRAAWSSLSSSGASFVLADGDFLYTTISNTVNEQTWCSTFKASISNLELEVGNHETYETNKTDGGGSINKFVQYCPFTLGSLTGTYGFRYYFDYPSANPFARFIMVDPGIWNGTSSSSSLSYSSGTANYAWVSTAIDSARSSGIPWVIVVMHKLCISTGSSGCEVSPTFMTMLMDKRVDVIIQAHDHTYQRSKQLTCATDGTFVSSCVAASGSSFVKGMGSVYVIDGTAGEGGGSTSSTKADNGYFQAYCCSNGTPIGYSLFTVTSSSLQSNFVNTGGLTYSDGFTITGNAPSPTFSITASPASLSFPPGGSSSSTITLSSQNGFAGTVSLSASSSPSGLTTSLNPSSVSLSSGGSASSTLSVSSSTTGSYTVTVTGTSGSLTKTTTVTTTVSSTPDFTISSTPSTLTVQPGVQGTTSVALSSLNGFSGTVALTASPSSAALTTSLNPTSVTLSSGGSATSTLTVSSSTPGSYTIVVTGTSGSLSHSTIVSVTVSLINPMSVVVASDGEVGPASIGTGGAEKLVQDSTSRMIAVYVDSSGRIALAYANSDPMVAGWSTPVKSATPGSAYIRPALALVSLTSLQVITQGGAAAGQIASISVTVQRDSQNNIIGFTFGPATILDPSGTAAYPTTILAHNGNVLVAWAFKTSTTSQVRSLRLDPGTGWTNFASTSSLPDNVIIDNASLEWMIPNIIERPDNSNVYLLANRLSSPTSTIAYNLAGWNGTAWQWGSQNLDYETNASTGVEDPVTFAWDPVASVAVICYGITGTQSFGVFTLSSAGVKTHLDTPSLAITERDWGTISVHVTTGDYYIFLMNVNTDGGSGTLGYIKHPVGGSWNSTVTYLDTATNNQGLNMRATGTSPTLDLVYAQGTSSPVTIRFTRISPVNPPSFGISASPTSLTVVAGSSGTSTITVTSLYGFTGTVGLSTTVSPTGLTASVNPASATVASGGTASSILTMSSTAGGTYMVAIQATSGSVSRSVTVAVKVVDFTISAPSSVTVVAGVSTTASITLASSNGFAGTVSLASTASPAGLSTSLNPTSVTLASGGASASTLTLSSSTVGTYTVTVVGTSGSLSHTVAISVSVVTPPDFNVSSSPSTVTFPVGSSGTSIETLQSVNGFKGSLTLSVSVSPSTGLTVTCNPMSFTLTSGGSASSTCGLSSSTAGGYSVIVSATNGTLTHSTTITVNVSDFSLSANPTSQTILVTPSSGTSTITLASVYGFSGTVNLGLSAPNGIAASLSQTSLGLTAGGTAASTVSFSSSQIGNYTVTITGTSGALTHSVQVTVRVVDFSVSTGTTSMTIFAGQSGTSTITVSSLGGFSGSVALVASVSTSGPTTSVNPTSVSLTTGGSGTSTLSVSSLTGGNFTVTITGTNGGVSHSVQISVNVVDYMVSANPSIVDIQSGTNSSSAIILTSVNGFSGVVAITTSTVPSTGLAVSCSPTSVSLASGGSANSTCTFSTSTQGTYTVTVTASSGPLSHAVTIMVGVGDFSMSPSPVTITVLAGLAGTSSITLTSIGGFAGTISLSASVSASSMSVSMSPASVSLTQAGTTSSMLTVSSGAAGTYTVTVTGTSGTLSHSVQVTVIVQDFGVSTDVSSLSLVAGTSGTVTVNIASVNGFTGIVSLSAVCSPSSPRLTFSSNSVSISSGGSGTVSLSVRTFHKTPPGSYTITITATSGTLTHTVTVVLTVT